MGNNYRMDYGVDLVFCIDATMSMAPLLDTVKSNALNFYQDFKNVMEAKRKRVGSLRIRIVADGGGDDPEDGLEALAYAMKSDWSSQATKRRHVIVVWTDDGTHDLGFGKSAPNYPAGMARDFNELTAWWGSRTNPGVMDENAKRLIIFAPNKNSWNTISDNWNNVIQYESEAGAGLQDCDYEQILSAICNSI